MNLQARRPPGHGKRKALSHAADIIRLRAEGHSLSAIREALEDAGVVVSISTVRREVLKGAAASGAFKPAAATADVPGALTTQKGRRSPVVAPGLDAGIAPLPGKGVAEEFMQNRPTNPLYLKESPP